MSDRGECSALLEVSLEDIGTVLRILLKAPNWRALTITEVNQDHAPDEAEIFGRLIAMLAGSLGNVAA